MTSVQSHHVVSHSHHGGHNLENNLDALLDDLQAGVGHRGEVVPHTTLVNGSSIHLPAGATGYRETTTTVTQERNGVPTTSRDYQIEYLNPANQVTVLSERGSSPIPDTMLRGVDPSGKQVASYKTASYQYKFSEKTTDAHGNPIRPDNNYSVSKAENVREGNQTGMHKNLNELDVLDVLLQELNTPNPPRRSEHTSRSVHRDYPQTSTPRSASLTRDAQHSHHVHQYGEIQGTPRAPQRDVHQYTEAPGTPRAPQRGMNVHREVNTIEHRSHTSRRDSPGSRDRSAELSPTLRRRTPSPNGEFRPATFSSYPHSPAETRRSRSQTRYEDSHVSSQVTSSESKYRTNYTNHASTARTDDPQPYRSPSPVSFPHHRSPSPVRRVVTSSDSGRALNRSDSGRAVSRESDRALTRSDSGRTYQISPNQPPLSDPSSPTVITYKYSSHSQQHSKYPGAYDDTTHGPRPFPTPTPLAHPGDQNPPKQIDDLMATFQDSQGHRSYSNNNEQYYREVETHHRQNDYQQRQNNELQRSPSFERNLRPSNVKATQVYHHPAPAQPYQPQPVQEVVPAPSSPSLQNKQAAARSVAGPPVFYPPGVELFAKKEEAYMEQQSAGGKGKMKAKAKAEYKYEASEKSKEKSGTRMAVVPACLPLCCAMPCSIM